MEKDSAGDQFQKKPRRGGVRAGQTHVGSQKGRARQKITQRQCGSDPFQVKSVEKEKRASGRNRKKRAPNNRGGRSSCNF